MKKNLLFFYIILISVLMLFDSCATTKIDGVKKPGTNFYEYQDVVVYCNLDNLKYKKNLENEIWKKFNKQNINVEKSIELLPPLKEYTDTEIRNVIVSTDSELCIEVKILSINSNNGSSSSFLIPVGDMFFGIDGSDVKVNMDFDITIYDIQNDFEILFRGTATSKEENDDFEDCIENIFESLADQLVKLFIAQAETKK